MEQEILEKLQQQEEKLDKIYKSMERLRKIFLWILILSVVMFVLPLIGLAVVLPTMINTMTSTYNSFGL